MKLHEAIAVVFGENEGWLTTQQIADELNKRKLYSKKDGTLITAFQVHGRTRNYSKLFVRDGSKVKLKRENL